MRIGELAARAGTTVRTVRYYVGQGLLPRPVGAGPRSVYGYEHLVRLAAIRMLKASYLPLSEIRRRLDGMRLEEIEALVVSPDAPEAALDAVGRPLGEAERAVTGRGGAGLPAAALAGGFGLPSARRELRRGAASSTPLPEVGSSLWRRVMLGPGVELSFQLSGDPARDGAIAELIEQATRRLAELGAAPTQEGR